LHEGSEEYHEEPVRIAACIAEIWARYLESKKQDVGFEVFIAVVIEGYRLLGCDAV
jgi:hypothetical protein